MATIIQFPKHQPVSATSRAANSANVSAVILAWTTRGVRNNGSHHSGGMRLRYDHLRAAYTLAPISTAMASGVGHKAITDLKESSDMEHSLRQSVLKSKSEVSQDWEQRLEIVCLMPPKAGISHYRNDFKQRVIEAREARGFVQEQIAELLGISQGKYQKYETRSMMPHDLIPLFCLACGIDANWLLTGKGNGPSQSRIAPDKPQKSVKRGRPRAA